MIRPGKDECGFLGLFADARVYRRLLGGPSTILFNYFLLDFEETSVIRVLFTQGEGFGRSDGVG